MKVCSVVIQLLEANKLADIWQGQQVYMLWPFFVNTRDSVVRKVKSKAVRVCAMKVYRVSAGTNLHIFKGVSFQGNVPAT
jgi:glutamate synthase domain-containing protein 1